VTKSDEEKLPSSEAEPPESSKETPPPPPPGSNGRRIPLVIAAGVATLLLLGAAMIWRAEDKTNKVALASTAKPVTVALAKAASFRPSRVYVGTLEPWVEARVGPQLVAAYIDTVLVRPGAVVKRNEILATLDCRSASAANQAVSMQARAIDAQQKAMADEALRLRSLLDGGFVSPNEAEQKTAQSSAREAELFSQRAKMMGAALEVNDCILKAPFDGEVATRSEDPGAFVRPGTQIVSVVDRSIVRIVGDAPEIDFGAVAPGTLARIHVLATGKDLTGTVARRAPAADPGTRTVHFEIDVRDAGRELPVGTTAEISIDVGEPVRATELPLYAAAIRGEKAILFVVEGDIAHSRTVRVVGEAGGSVFLDPELAAGSRVVTDGRALLEDGDRVASKQVPTATTSAVVDGPPKRTQP
jgi:membrane fusion protein, multidrug efflux system